MLLLLAALEGRAHAYCRTTTCGEGRNSCEESAQLTDPDICKDPIACCWPVIWKRPCVSYSLDTSNLRPDEVDDFRAILTGAFEAWTSVTCPETNRRPQIAVEDAWGPVLCGHAEYNGKQGNANIITFRKNWPYDPRELGHTVVTWDEETGALLDADIEMNADVEFTLDFPTEGYDLQSVLTHEIGHFFGIAHTSSTLTSSIMVIEFPITQNLRAVRPDDREAFCSMYSKRPRGVCDYTPVNGFVAECAFDPSSGGWCAAQPAGLPRRGARLALFLGVLGLAAATLRRRRRMAAR